MRFPTKFIPGVLLLAIWVRSPADTPPAAAAPAGSTYSRSQIIENWGWLVAQERQLAGVELSDAERAIFLKGFLAGAQNQPAPGDLQAVADDVKQLAAARREKKMQATMAANAAAADAFLARRKTTAQLTEQPDHTWVEMLRRGTGEPPAYTQTVLVHYTARLLDGTEFSQAGPLDFVLVTNRSVCRGWVAALQKIGAGGALKLYVPPPLSEDEAAGFGIEPGSLMIFEVELLGITNTSPEDLANATLPPAPPGVAPPPAGCPAATLMETWGWIVAREARIGQFHLEPADLACLAKGVAAGIREAPATEARRKMYPAVQQFIAAQKAAIRRQTRRQRQAEMESLFAGLKSNTNVVELPDGLRYEVVQPGHGPYPRPGQIVVVDYTGRLFNGTVFDKTYNEPLHIEIGSVIDGLNEGLQKLKLGGKIKLYVPPALGYGNEDRSGVVAPIPADSVLLYEIELLGIQDP